MAPGRRGRRTGKYSQAARTLRLLDRLVGRKAGCALHDLAGELGVTERQIRRDLLALEEAGNVIEHTTRDGRSAVRLAEANARGLFLTRRERYSLLAVRRVFDVLRGTPFFEDVDSIYDKLVGLMSADERAELATFGERFVFVPDGGTKPFEGKDDVLDALQTGVLHRRLVSYRYRAATGKVRSGLLAPYSIILYKNGLYVVGRPLRAAVEATTPPGAGELPYVYAVERFDDAEFVPGTTFTVPEHPRLDTLFQGAFGIFFNGKPRQVTVEFSRDVTVHVKARRFHPSQRLEDAGSGRLRLTFHVANLAEVVPWVMAWGPHARALEPPELVDRIRREHEDAAGAYRE